MVLLIMSSSEVTSRVNKRKFKICILIWTLWTYVSSSKVTQCCSKYQIWNYRRFTEKYYAENISTLMRVVGTLNNTRPSRQLSPKDSQVVYSFGFSYENFLFKSETSLLIEIFINLQTPMIFFACERDVVRITECYTSRFDFAVHQYILRQ